MMKNTRNSHGVLAGLVPLSRTLLTIVEAVPRKLPVHNPMPDHQRFGLLKRLRSLLNVINKVQLMIKDGNNGVVRVIS